MVGTITVVEVPPIPMSSLHHAWLGGFLIRAIAIWRVCIKSTMCWFGAFAHTTTTKGCLTNGQTSNAFASLSSVRLERSHIVTYMMHLGPTDTCNFSPTPYPM